MTEPHLTDGFGGAQLRPEVPAPGEEDHRHAGEGLVRNLHRSVVPGAQGSRRQREGRRTAKIVAEEPNTRGVQWLNYSDRPEALAMPLPGYLANHKREISEKKWAEARQ